MTNPPAAVSRTTLETQSGLYFDYVDPRPEQVDVDDIAHALAHTVRFGGHVDRYYSVAEHSLLVAHYVEKSTGDYGLTLAALFHDGHEAYLGDIPTPLKRLLGGAYYNMRDAVDAAIATKIGIDPFDFHHPAIAAADALALRVEARQLKASRGESDHWAAWVEDPTPAPDPPRPFELGLRPFAAKLGFRFATSALLARLGQ